MRQESLKPSKYRRIAVLDIETLAIDPTDSKGALDALTGRILCIGLLFDDGANISETVILHESEDEILRSFWATIQGTDYLVGHNILDFDLPFIKQRSWIKNVEPTRGMDIRKYYTSDIFDTMQIWSNWGFKKGVTLDNLGKALGVGCKTGHGTDVSQWWTVRDFNSIRRYCLEDVRLTYRVFQRMTYQLTPSVPITADALISVPA